MSKNHINSKNLDKLENSTNISNNDSTNIISNNDSINIISNNDSTNTNANGSMGYLLTTGDRLHKTTDSGVNWTTKNYDLPYTAAGIIFLN